MDRCRRCCHLIYCGTRRDFPSSQYGNIFLLLTGSCELRKMRKTRLVILPTKCLHQMGFLLLFLSCPVIGDWGRIRPESEDSHNAIQIEREGTCGLGRDPPGGLLNFLDDTGSKQCRLSEDSDSITPTRKAHVEVSRRSHERQIDVRRVDQQRKTRMSERRTVDERKISHKMVDERRDVRRESERRVRRDVRSRSLDSRRTLANRNDVRARSLSLNRLDNERAIRNQRSLHVSRDIRHYNEENSRRESGRLHLSRRMNERQEERRVERQQRSNRELQNERRESERTTRNISERREVARFSRTAEGERQDIRRDSRRSMPELSMNRRENDMARRQSRERVQNVRENRLSLARRELNEARRVERTESRRNSERVNLNRRLPEIRKTRSKELLGNKSERRETVLSDNRREVETRRLMTLSPKLSERKALEREIGSLNERVEGIKSRRISTTRHDNVPDLYLKEKEEEKLFGGITKWMDFTSYENFKTGDWTTNCVIGAVVYFLTTRQVKTV